MLEETWAKRDAKKLTAHNSQNNSRLDELANKVSALRGVTIDIYDNARDQRLLDSNVRFGFLKSSTHTALSPP